MLSKSDSVLAIDAEFTRPGVKALLREFKKKLVDPTEDENYEFDWNPDPSEEDEDEEEEDEEDANEEENTVDAALEVMAEDAH